MRFLPYRHAAAVPNIIVDGAANEGTVVTLSHWPKSGSPVGLRADTSTEIVFRYLDTPRYHVQVDAVSNNHFDEDGLLGLFVLLHPGAAERRRALLIDVAQAGDFGVYGTREAARIAFVLAAYADAARSPLGPQLFSLPYADMAGELYVQLFDVLPALLADITAYRSLWEAEDARLSLTERLLDEGRIGIEERPELDLAVIRMPAGVEAHAFALHTRTPCTRLFVARGSRVEVQYRYESWVQMASRRPALRVDLSGLAAELTAEEHARGSWVFDGVDEITPALSWQGRGPSSMTPDDVLARLERYLKTGAPAWNPYD